MKKCRKRMGALRLLFGRKHKEAKIKAFKAIVQPVIGYCAALWIPWQSTHLKRLEKLHKELASDVGWEALSSGDWLSRTKLLPADRLKEQRWLLLLYKIAKRKCPGFDELLQPYGDVKTKNRL